MLHLNLKKNLKLKSTLTMTLNHLHYHYVIVSLGTTIVKKKKKKYYFSVFYSCCMFKCVYIKPLTSRELHLYDKTIKQFLKRSSIAIIHISHKVSKY